MEDNLLSGKSDLLQETQTIEDVLEDIIPVGYSMSFLDDSFNGMNSIEYIAIIKVVLLTMARNGN